MNFLNELFQQFVPSALSEDAHSAAERLHTALDAAQLEKLQAIFERQAELRKQFSVALVGSHYVLDRVCFQPELLFYPLLSDSPFEPITPVKIFDAVDTRCADEMSLDEFNRVLRKLRQEFMCSLYWRMLNQLAEFDEVGKAMTAMAEAFARQALRFHHRALVEKHGYPTGKESGQPQPMLIVGMGKLGGGELNVSSDIDLIFVFPEAGQTNHKSRPIDNQQFFNRLGQLVIKSLNDTTVDGFVFRVDMRLRPWGESGALTSNYNALENYYETQGRDWERYAAIKARIIACSPAGNDENDGIIEQEATEQFYKILQPFVYRRYVDFSTIESLRKLKQMIEQEVRRKGKENDVKLGSGGIREIEFIAQSFQLVRGGLDLRLQQKNCLMTLSALVQSGDLSLEAVERLQSAYIFLRNTEHAIQAWKDTQTQRLPNDEVECERLAWVMGFEGWKDFFELLNQYRDIVAEAFAGVIADAHEGEQKIVVESCWKDVWQQEIDSKHIPACLKSFNEPENLLRLLSDFRHGRRVASLSASAKEKLDQFMPYLLQVVASEDGGDLAWIRVLNWFEAIVTRASYITLLLENPQVVQHLVKLFNDSSWVSDTLTEMPSLLDELLHPEQLYSLPDRDSLDDELRQRLLRLDPEDAEAHIIVLRYFRLSHSLHVAAAELSGRLPLMKASDYLSFIAEVVLKQVLMLAWRDMVAKYGYPEGATDAEPGFLIVGYGKLGGLELSYSSDLDLVFIYDADLQSVTTGEKSIDVQTFYIRLGQKIIHILNTRTLSGQLYEVDMRLRPSGNSGLLVSSLNAFKRYQDQDAWVWEHQALVRARPIAGDQALAQRFMAVRRDVLSIEREPEKLRQEVIAMRQKMRDHLGAEGKAKSSDQGSDEFHLKQDAGGIVDIEFMVQYAVLAWSHQAPSLTEWTDNIRLLERLRDLSFIDSEQATRLIDIYQSYRRYSHRLALQQADSSVINAEQFANERQQVSDLWDYFFTLHK